MTQIYNNFKELLFNGGIDFDTDQIEVALVSDSIAYAPNIDTEVFVADVLDGVVAAELGATNYVRKTLTITASQDNVNDTAVADAADLVWTNLGGATDDTIAGMLVFKQVTDDTDSPLVEYASSANFPLPTNGGDVTLTIDSNGLLKLA